MKLNCDLGESFGVWPLGCDEAIMPHIDMANIACGFHASDPLTMSKTVALAKSHQVTIGAHPSYPDLVGFGRRSMAIPAEELTAIILYQIGALSGFCQAQQTSLSYVKPHGALYNDMMKDLSVFKAVCQAISQFNQGELPLVIQAIPAPEKHQAIAASHGISLLFEAFADRNYNDDGSLVSRQQSNAVIEDVELMINRCEHLLSDNELLSINNKPLKLQVDTLCVHGDNASAVQTVAQLRQRLSALST